VVFGGGAISTYALDELLGTKMRALYQRKKGRDLFDLALALDTGAVDPERVVAAFSRYMEHGGHQVSRAEFERNIAGKLADPIFNADIGHLLATGFPPWDSGSAAARVHTLIERLPGAPWQGDGAPTVS
jgi:predicted nucleotidyltransferase component of viral defense system